MTGKSSVQLDRLALFAAVAEASGFTAAAARLGTSKTVLSQQVSKLEAEFGAPLLMRTTRRVALTETGQRVLDECGPLLRDLTAALQRLSDANQRLVGTLRVTAPPEFAAGSLGVALGEFAREHPRLRIDLLASSEVIDLARERVDLALRFGSLRSSSLRATRLGDFEQWVVAAPAYLARAGVPKHPDELAQHRFLELSLLQRPLAWRFTSPHGHVHDVRLEAYARANSPAALVGLLRGGLGLSAIGDFCVDDDLKSGRLQRVLPTWSLPKGGIYAVYPAGPRTAPKVRAFVDFLRSYLLR